MSFYARLPVFFSGNELKQFLGSKQQILEISINSKKSR